MNWTGGSLHRHSKNAHKSVVNRQKEHFAKIRTALQNGSLTSTVPFRPNYLADDSDKVLSQLTPFGTGSVRHTGHPKRLRKGSGSESLHAREEDPTSGKDTTQHPTEMAVSSRTRHRRSRGPNSPSAAPFPPGSGFGKARGSDRLQQDGSDVAVEHQLLEANRARLLQQQDWAGLAAQRPAKLHFPSIREKDGIGKRRRVNRDHDPALQANMKNAMAYPYRRQTHDNHPGAYTNEALENDIKDIRIRFGTGALRSETSVQKSNHAKALQPIDVMDEVADPMLFDQEESILSPKVLRASPRSVSIHNDALAAAVMNQHPKWIQGSNLSEQHGGQQTPKRLISPRPIIDAGLHGNPCRRLDVTNDAVKHLQAPPQSQPELSNPSILRIGRGGNNPLRLIIDNCSEDAASMGAAGGPGPVGDGEVKGDVACKQANAGLPDFGYPASRESGEREYSRTIDGRSTSILDERQWKAAVDASKTSSSRSPRSLSASKQPPITRNAGEGVTCSWSQRATLGGGGQSWAHLTSPISSSLPSIDGGTGMDTVRNLLGADDKTAYATRERQSHGMSESERIWRDFVFRSSEESASESHTDDNCTGRRSRSSFPTEQGGGVSPSDCAGPLPVNSNWLLPVPEREASEPLQLNDMAWEAADRCSKKLTCPGMRALPAVSSTGCIFAEGHDRVVALSKMQPEATVMHRLEKRTDFGNSQTPSVKPVSLFHGASNDTFSSGTYGSGPDRHSEAA